jgi:hypothetical protein
MIKKISLGLLIFVITTTVNANGNTNTVHAVQLMLYLKGYDLGYGDSKGIDGEIGSRTLRAISEYKQTLPIDKRSTTDLIDLKKILEDDIKLGKAQSDPDTGNINQDLNTLKNELKNTKNDLNREIQPLSRELKTLKDGMSDRFISYFVSQSSLLASFLALLIIVVTFSATFWIKKLIEKIEKDNYDHRQKMLDDAEKKHQEMLALSDAEIGYKVYVNLSHACYLEYRNYMNDKNNVQLKNKVNQAIWFIERAINNVNKLKDGDGKEKKVLFVAAHKAYHLASKKLNGYPIDAHEHEESLKIASELSQSNSKFFKEGSENWIDNEDTIAWILIGFDKKEEGELIIQKIMKSTHLLPSKFEELKENYNSIGYSDSTHKLY